MPVEVKFCGLTRAADAALGEALGARYLGVVFAASPRQVDTARARTVFAGVSASRGARRVGVFGRLDAETIAAIAADVSLDVAQLHSDPSPAEIAALRRVFGGEIWAARRIDGAVLPNDLLELAGAADRVLLDARSGVLESLGGTGRTFDWAGTAGPLAPLRRRAGYVLAGGLTPGNVARAISQLDPAIVDVSSGVERSPGVKDEQLMRSFMRAVEHAAGNGGEGRA
ncbi:MAG: phosphoribosylanthranilate isomerase [Gemmatimonadaceae bacterium]